MEFNRITGKKKYEKRKIHTKIIKRIKRIVISNKISSRIFPQLLKFALVCIWRCISRKCGSIVEYIILNNYVNIKIYMHIQFGTSDSLVNYSIIVVIIGLFVDE